MSISLRRLPACFAACLVLLSTYGGPQPAVAVSPTASTTLSSPPERALVQVNTTTEARSSEVVHGFTSTPAAARPTPTSAAASTRTLTTYTAPDKSWTIRYPANELQVEQLPGSSITLFISRDRATFVAVDSFMGDPSTYGNTGEGLRNAAADALAKIYGKAITTLPRAVDKQSPWAARVEFTTDKGSEGEAVYMQPNRTRKSARVFGVVYGFKSDRKATAGPLVKAVRESFSVADRQAAASAQGSIMYTSRQKRFQIDLASGAQREIGAASIGADVVAQDGRRFWLTTGAGGRTDGFTIFTASRNETTGRPLLTMAQLQAQFPDINEGPGALTLSADGQQLFFDPCVGDEVRTQCRFVALDLKTHKVRDLAFPCGWGARLAPDGQRALGTAKFYHPEGGTYFPTVLFQKGQPTELQPGAPRAVEWLADGKVLFSTSSEWSGKATDANLVLHDRNGKLVRTLVQKTDIDELTLAPKGTTVAYRTVADHKLWLINLDGTGQQQIAKLPADAKDLVWVTP